VSRLISITPVLLLAGQCLAVGPDCTRHDSHASYRTCLERQAARADADLVHQENALRSKIGRWDETVEAKQRRLHQFDLDVAAYRRYRQARCDYEASRAAGGNGAHDMRLSCRIELDAQRSAMLRDDVVSFDARRS
jgi:uncharacterized protein YecT (DUF1311 family)